MEICAICGCLLHRDGDYAKPSLKGRSHATKHHYIPERFFGRSKNRKGTQREPIFDTCPWNSEGKTAVFCYECHEELLHNPVMLPNEINAFSKLVHLMGLSENKKTEDKTKIAGRIKLMHKIISRGLKEMLEDEDGRNSG